MDVSAETPEKLKTLEIPIEEVITGVPSYEDDKTKTFGKSEYFHPPENKVSIKVFEALRKRNELMRLFNILNESFSNNISRNYPNSTRGGDIISIATSELIDETMRKSLESRMLKINHYLKRFTLLFDFAGHLQRSSTHRVYTADLYDPRALDEAKLYIDNLDKATSLIKELLQLEFNKWETRLSEFFDQPELLTLQAMGEQ